MLISCSRDCMNLWGIFCLIMVNLLGFFTRKKRPQAGNILLKSNSFFLRFFQITKQEMKSEILECSSILWNILGMKCILYICTFTNDLCENVIFNFSPRCNL